MNQDNFILELKKLNINITELQLKQLERYYELLVEYNKVMNLTGITIKEEVYLKHFYDSLTIAKVIDLNNYQTLCDVGTGAGFPGLVLKIIYPNLKVTLLDSLNKRLNFLNVVIKELNLKDIETVHSRAEEYNKKFDITVARAVAPLNILLEYCIPLTKVNGYFIAMKGKNEEATNALKELNSEIIQTNSFLLPIEQSNRTIIKIKKIKETNKKFPRKYSEIKKKHL